MPEDIKFSQMKDLVQLADQCAAKMAEYIDQGFTFQEITNIFSKYFLDQFKDHLSDNEVDVSIPGGNIRPVVDKELRVQQVGLDLATDFLRAVNARMRAYNKSK